MKLRKIIIGIIIISLLILTAVISDLNGRRSAPWVSAPTTYDTGRAGYKALYLLLGKMGFSVGRSEIDPMLISREKNKCMFIIKPYLYFLSPARARKIYDWALDGNCLIIADDDPGNLIWEDLAVSLYPVADFKETVIKVKKDTPGLKNVKTVIINSPMRIKIPPPGSHPFTVHLEDINGPICVSTEVGKGRVFVISAPEIFNNFYIEKEDNVIFITDLITSTGNKTVYVDESMHGFIRESAEKFVLSPLSLSILAQLAFTIVIFYLVFMIRFGRPRKFYKLDLRMSIEYVYSLAALFLKANSQKFVLESIMLGFRRRLALLFGFTPGHDNENLWQKIQYLPTEYKDSLSRVLKDYEKIMSSEKITDKELLHFSSVVEKSLPHGKQL